MKGWIGIWLIGVAVVHTLFALVVFRGVLGSIFSDGFFSAVGNDPMRGAVVWFLLFGFAVFIAGQAIVTIERSGGFIPHSLGWSLFALTALGISLMPDSGFWLVIPPAVGILRAKSTGPPARRPR